MTDADADADAHAGASERATAKQWLQGCRPRTLPAAIVPVVVGSTAAWSLLHSWSLRPGQSPPPPWAVVSSAVKAAPAVEPFVWWRAGAALIVALAVQIGTNFANDYADGVRGTDEQRVGPARLVASGAASPSAVRSVALGCFGVAAVAGLALAAVTSWWLVAVGAACFVAGWTYTGGPKPYGYLGLGEVFVFAFFGVVATVGSAWVQLGHWEWLPLLAALPVGFLAVALLEANNLRDLDGDATAGKRTLAVRLGPDLAPWLYVGALLAALAGVAAVAVLRPWALLALLALPLAIPPSRLALSGVRGRALLPALGATGRLQLIVGLALVLGLLL